MNDKKVNVKYLPNINLPDNITAVPSMLAACVDATLVIFVMPFQFLKPVLPTIKKVISKEPHARGVSLIKEIHFDTETLGVKLVSKQIEEGISHKHMPHKFQCGVLMGANVASEIASGDFSESTLASRFRTVGADDLNEKTRLLLNNSESFRVYHISDVEGCEACGALKNVVALGAGFVDGLGMGGNTKAALMRIGIQEMEQFCNDFLSNVDRNTFQESCGMADLITTCIGGRNRKCGEAFAKHTIAGQPKSWDAIEAELLNGQRLRGVKVRVRDEIRVHGAVCHLERWHVATH
jgi:glycerol-3-phosphate dehydrogenase (NAD+)